MQRAKVPKTRGQTRVSSKHTATVSTWVYIVGGIVLALGAYKLWKDYQVKKRENQSVIG